jgi:hypothetical protein
MKNLIRILIIVCCIPFSACMHEEKDIFAESPAERMSKSVQAYKELLMNNDKTWVMEYFPNSSSPGYIMIMKFHPSGRAYMSMQNEVSNHMLLKDSSLYEVIADYGPVLTFNTFNRVMHAFSNPENPDGYGLMGDYEFILMEASGDTLYMKGKKYKSEILLYSYNEIISSDEYLQQLNAFGRMLFSKSSPQLTLNPGKFTYYLTNGYTNIFNLSRGNFTMDIPFIIKKNGIRFQSEIELDGIKLREFVINQDQSGLVSTTHPDIVIQGPVDLSNYFINNAIEWELNCKDGGSAEAAYNQLIQNCIDIYGATDIKIGLRYFNTRRGFVLTISYKSGIFKNEGNLDLAVSSSKINTLSILFRTSGDSDGMKMISDLPSLDGFLKHLTGTFALGTNLLINPSNITLTKNSDNTIKFEILRK